MAVLPGDGGAYKFLIAQQRGWDYTTDECQALDDVDESLGAAGLNANGEPLNSRIWVYDPVTDAWTHIAWELAPLPAHAAWVGLSEITRALDGSYVVLERDNLSGDFATLKTLVRIQLDAVANNLISSGEKSVYGMLPNLKATNGWITDKPEGVAITSNGRTFVVIDNDGVEDWSGETWFLDLGHFQQLFR